MRIGFVCYEAFVDGGISVYARELLSRMASTDHRVTLFASLPNGFENNLDPAIDVRPIPVPPVPLTAAPAFGAMLPLALRRAEREEGPFDIVHSNTYADSLLPKFATRGVRVITVHHLGTSAAESAGVSFLKRLLRPSREYGPGVALEGLCLKRADHLIAVSEFTRADVLRRYPDIDPNSVTVVHLGSIDRSSRANFHDIISFKRRLGILDGDRILLYVGRLEDRKGISVLFRAIAHLGLRTPAKLLLIGSGNQKPYKTLAREEGIEDRVIFAGFVDEKLLDAGYKLASILVHPASLEGFGLTVADAVASGLPVVASNVGALPEIVRDGIDGYLVEYGDSQALSRAIARTLSTTSIGSRASTNPTPSKLTWEATIHKTLALYERLLSGHED
jgi:glycosyltransferase involved in cell wall biosynthesis